MKINSYYPVLCVNNMKEAVAFYKTYFGLESAFENDWYSHLTMSGDTNVNLAIMNATHESVPQEFQKKAQGVLLNFEIDNVDAFYEECKTKKLNIILELRDEPWGQRHFIISDPSGVMIDVIKLIEPSEEFKINYSQ